MVVTATPRLGAMQLETSYLRTQVTMGSSFGLWKVCWLGGDARQAHLFGDGCTHHRTNPTLIHPSFVEKTGLSAFL